MRNITSESIALGRVSLRGPRRLLAFIFPCQCTFSLLGETAEFFHLSTASNLFISAPVYNLLLHQGLKKPQDFYSRFKFKLASFRIFRPFGENLI